MFLGRIKLALLPIRCTTFWRAYLVHDRDPFATGPEHFGEGAVIEAAARCEQVR